MSGELGRRLPPGSRFATVEALFDLPNELRERTEYAVAGRFDGKVVWRWYPVERLLRSPAPGESTLALAPSGLVLVVREAAA